MSIYELGNVINGVTHNKPNVVAFVVLFNLLRSEKLLAAAACTDSSNVIFCFGDHR